MDFNMGAMVDSSLRFLYVVVLPGGKSSDIQVITSLFYMLKHWIENLPPQYFVAGDTAHVCIYYHPFVAPCHFIIWCYTNFFKPI
jgi:hypothetical protein